mmetsp:Transcript_70566/g.202170  ORF Transcript_70566/g.202170 Transcript_70566/m.202170 type:complete len:209 (-) Transcript_70566:511-1137(-)
MGCRDPSDGELPWPERGRIFGNNVPSQSCLPHRLLSPLGEINNSRPQGQVRVDPRHASHDLGVARLQRATAHGRARGDHDIQEGHHLRRPLLGYGHFGRHRREDGWARIARLGRRDGNFGGPATLAVHHLHLRYLLLHGGLRRLDAPHELAFVAGRSERLLRWHIRLVPCRPQEPFQKGAELGQPALRRRRRRRGREQLQAAAGDVGG